ncbi:MAG: acylhydrolase, partial [Bacteroidota bacterium]|nr:acylhydrolase [Bacteroidota bacterium]
ELNTMLKYYCEGKGLVYLDYFSELVDDVNGLPEALSYDGVHPTDEGYQVMEPLALAAIKEALKD